tara:strand:- start:126 stop:323 length:198 start_codon:yes stop_codon:yes gene_type:complete
MQGPRKGRMRASSPTKIIADSRILTNQGGAAELKRLGLTADDLIKNEKGASGIKGSTNKVGPVRL